jgi:hypothetical protein
MAKRAGSSRGRKAGAGRAARSATPRHARDASRDETISAEAAGEIANTGLAVDAKALEKVIEDHVAEPGRPASPTERAQHADDVAAEAALTVTLIRRLFTAHDEEERPFVRVVGRIVFLLTVEGGHTSCTATPIAVTLLLFLPGHLDPVHQQAGKSRDTIDVTEINLQGVLYDRLKKLTSEKWLRMLEKLAEGRGYQLTEVGRYIFHAWPTDVEFDPRHSDIWARRRPSARGGGRPRKPHPKR